MALGYVHAMCLFLHCPVPASNSSGMWICVQAQLVDGTAHEQGQEVSTGEQLQAAGCSPIHLPTHPPAIPMQNRGMYLHKLSRRSW